MLRRKDHASILLCISDFSSSCVYCLFQNAVSTVCSDPFIILRVAPLYTLTVEYWSLHMLQLWRLQKTLAVPRGKAIIFQAQGTQKELMQRRASIPGACWG